MHPKQIHIFLELSAIAILTAFALYEVSVILSLNHACPTYLINMCYATIGMVFVLFISTCARLGLALLAKVYMAIFIVLAAFDGNCIDNEIRTFLGVFAIPVIIIPYFYLWANDSIVPATTVAADLEDFDYT